MSAQIPRPQAAGVATKLRVRPGCEASFNRWQAQLTRAASAFPGFLSLEILPLCEGSLEWRVMQQFRSAEELDRWTQSAARRHVLDASAALRDGDFEDENVPDFHAWGSVTEVVVTAVKQGQEAAFRRWSETIQTAQAEFSGYMGTYVQAPPTREQPAWTTLVRFASPAQLDAWLTSPVRRDLITQSERLVHSWKSHRMPSSFAGWFPAGAGGSPPAAWKLTCIVLLVLFPVVALELRYLSPFLRGLNGAFATFIGNAISVSLVSWPLVPLAARALGWWLQPPAGRRWQMELLGGAVLIAMYAAEIGFFGYVL